MPWLNVPHLQQAKPDAVVLAGFSQEEAHLFDPALESGPVAASIDEMMLAWSYSDYTYAVLQPAA
jgi:hypothetical protein